MSEPKGVRFVVMVLVYTTYNWKTIEKTDKPESDTDS